MYKRIVKPFFDVLLAAILVLLLAPVFLVVSLLLWAFNNQEIFFLQERIGKDNKQFVLFKFKSMNNKRDSDGLLLPDLQRITPIGKFIRKTSLDELPQLFNIIKGEMSLVGPRPLLPEYLPYYNEHHIRRHEVRPGITGLAQVSGRNDLKFSERFNLDVTYVDNVCFSQDVKILFRTFLKVIMPSKDIKLGKNLSDVDDVGVSQGLKAK